MNIGKVKKLVVDPDAKKVVTLLLEKIHPNGDDNTPIDKYDVQRLITLLGKADTPLKAMVFMALQQALQRAPGKRSTTELIVPVQL